MKKLFTICLLLVASHSFGQSQTNAGEYMDYFSESYSVMQKDMWDYTKSVSHGRSARKVEKRRMELIQSSNAALSKAKRAKGFKSDEDYRDAVITYFEIINAVLKEDYAKIVDMEEVAEQSYDAMEAYMLARELASDKQKDASESLSAAQKKFAEANNIQLVESNDSMDKKLAIADKVYDHYNEVFLIFFKSSKQEMYLLEAINTNDVNSIEQNREALKATLEEGFGKLQDVTLYEGDRAMVDATRNLFKFYEREAEKDMQMAVDYFLKTENFQKIKAAFEEKKPKNRTQEDVDQYNTAVEEMNAAVEAYNTR